MISSKKVLAGIDPGQKGAIAVFGPDGLDIWDLKDCISVTGNFRSLDVTKFSTLLDKSLPYLTEDIALYCEESLLIHGNGIKTARPIFDSRGVLRAVCELRGLSVQYVPPATWKRYFGLLKKDKSASVQKAIDLLPQCANFFRKHYRNKIIDLDGRAEAVLIALYGRRKEKE